MSTERDFRAQKLSPSSHETVSSNPMICLLSLMVHFSSRRFRKQDGSKYFLAGKFHEGH